MSQTIPDRIDDHEQRITDLEYALWRIGSAAVAVEPPAEKKPPAVLRLVENDELTQEGR